MALQSTDTESVLTALQILHNLLSAPDAKEVWLEHIVRFGVLGRINALVESAKERDTIVMDEASAEGGVDTTVLVSWAPHVFHTVRCRRATRSS